MPFDENEDIFPVVRKHQEIMYDGTRFFWRGKLAWTLKFTDQKLAKRIFQNATDAEAVPNEWIRVEFTPSKRGY